MLRSAHTTYSASLNLTRYLHPTCNRWLHFRANKTLAARLYPRHARATESALAAIKSIGFNFIFFFSFQIEVFQSGSLYSCLCIFQNNLPWSSYSSIWYVLYFPPLYECNPFCLQSYLNSALSAVALTIWRLQCYFTISSVTWLRVWSPQDIIHSRCQSLVAINSLIYLSMLWIAVYKSLLLLWENTTTVNKGDADSAL